MLATILLTSLAMAEEGGGLSDAETSYTGAVILDGQTDVDFVDHGPGPTADEGVTTYTYWSGNTLYMGAEDEYGSSIDGIVEFFWFESSIDRGSDFYVAVIKARTTPKLGESQYLSTSSALPVQEVLVSANYGSTQAFRWDWSLPFENYGMESYGQVTLRNSYGVGGSAEGSAMGAKKVTDPETNATAEVTVQTKGHVSSEYNVKTEYTNELYRWNTIVNGRPGEMLWSTTLETSDRKEQSAYYEYFLVMQAEEGSTFTIDTLELFGGTEGSVWTGWSNRYFSVEVTDIELSRPAYTPDEPTDTGDTGSEDTGDTGEPWFGDDTGSEEEDPSGDPSGGPTNPFADPGEADGFFGCSTTSTGGSFAGFGMLLAGLALLFRRRD